MDLNEPETWRWIWLTATVLFAVGELSVPGTFFMLSFAGGGLVATVIAFAGAAIAIQWLGFVGVTAVSFAVLVPIGRHIDRDTSHARVGATRWAGRVAVVLDAIPGGPHATGLVRVEREQWRAESADGRPVPAGASVKVLRVDGTRLIVGPPEHRDEPGAKPAPTGPPS